MTEDFESNQFGCDFAEEGNPAFKARKNKNKILPDLSKCQVFSLANLMEMNDQLNIPEKKPGTFQMPAIKNPATELNKPNMKLPPQSKQVPLVKPQAPSKQVESIFGSDPRVKAMNLKSTEQALPLTRSGSGFGGQIVAPVNRPLEMKKQNNLSLNDITIQSDLKFKIDQKLSEVLHVPSNWVTYREFTLAFFKFHKTVGNFYDKPTQTFDLSKYQVFRRWWPNHQRIGCDDIKAFLLNN